MKTQEQIVEAIKTEELESGTIDHRDFSRLVDFFSAEQWPLFGFKPEENADIKIKEWTRENILEQLKGDLAFAFQKALDCRGLSAGAMYATVKMWMYVLDDQKLYGLNETQDDYTWYGLPFLKAVAVTYGFENPIGDDTGSERKYTESGE